MALAVMGSAMARVLFDIERPTVGLLNIGVEEVKGGEEIRDLALRFGILTEYTSYLVQEPAAVTADVRSIEG